MRSIVIYLRLRTERVALDDELLLLLTLGAFGFFSLVERFVERAEARVRDVFGVSLSCVESAPAARASARSRAANTSSREGTQSFFSKFSRLVWMLS